MSDTPKADKAADSGLLQSRLVHPCGDCGKDGEWPLLMNTSVAGLYQYLCPDCREENDPDNVMQTPCPKCHGSGREWEGWDCEYCDGMGTEEF